MIQKSQNLKTAIVGTGNLAWHLGHIFFENAVDISCIIGRNETDARELALILKTDYSTDLTKIPADVQIVILAISDSAVEDVIHQLPVTDKILVHTSGSLDINIFKNRFQHYGVIYPFQTFTRGITLMNRDFTVCVEANNEQTSETINMLAQKISPNVVEINSEKRSLLHLCGVLVNNFTNHLLTKATDLTLSNDIDPQLLMPLIRETIDKLNLISPTGAQTGPARRHNSEIIEKHLRLIGKDHHLKKLYSSLTDSIIAYYSKT